MPIDPFLFISSRRTHWRGKRGKIQLGVTPSGVAPTPPGTPAVVTITLDTALGVTIKLN